MKTPSKTRLCGCGVFLLVFCLLSAKIRADEIDFNRDVRPILSDRCFACHGPDPQTREADLRLDLRDSVVEDRGGYAVVVPGDFSASELLTRVTSQDDSDRMPPPEFGKPLSREEIEILKQWIASGAEYEVHWAYRPILRPDVPIIPGESTHPIDAFIRRKQLDAGVKMNRQADRRTLLRRLSFDLTGLPPEYSEIKSFEAETAPNAYEQQVDRLLKSPHYGERMAIYWLDLVRYADTLGYHGDQVRSVSPYRDYVIAAFNENKPFDQFTREQLAGDLLPDATLWQKVASTYNRINRASAEGGVQPKEYLAKYAADRVRTAGTVWLGSTFGCAECHDHKFDPFSTKDFYSFAAFFADIKEQGIVSGANHIEQMPVPTPQQRQRQAELNQAIAVVEQQLQTTSPELTQAFEDWQQQAQAAADRWSVAMPVDAVSSGGATLTIEEGGLVVASGTNPDKDTYTLEVSTDLPQVGALKLEALASDALPGNGPGRAGNGNFVVNKIELQIGEQKLEWAAASSTHDQSGFPAANLVSNDKGWAVLPKFGQDHHLILEGKESISIVERESESEAPRTLRLTIQQNHGGGHSLGRFRISLAETSSQAAGSIVPAPSILAILQLEPAKRSKVQIRELDQAFRQWTPLLQGPRDELARLQNEKKSLEASIVTTLVSVSTTPREMRVLPRGNWMDDSGEVVQPAFPEFLSQVDQEHSADRLTRLDLADWLVNPQNPLVARTFVNRLWMLLMGHGLSRSVDDLGAQGEVPTHPELLDWLAAEFLDSGWDVKHIVKLIVMSNTYQQASVGDPTLMTRDPYNRLYARQSKWRLDAEMIRDNALAVSGLLNREIGGVSAKPYQPAGYWAQLNFPKRTYQHDTNAKQYRRGLYTHWQRTFLHPSLLAFDAPPREECTARRERSNTPLQALVLLNDPTYVEAARKFAERIANHPVDGFEGKLEFAFQECLARIPNANEKRLLEELFTTDLQRFRSQEQQAAELLSTGIAAVDESTDRAELAAWTGVARVLFNLHETITRY